MDIKGFAVSFRDRIAECATAAYASTLGHSWLQKENIEFVPFGVRDSKTHVPGFYRKVGDTCPPFCPYLNNGCYSQGGRVELQQRRASNNPDATVASFVACTVISLTICHVPSRMFVSGDLYRKGRLDRTLIRKLKGAADILRGVFPEHQTLAYGYSHCHSKWVLKELSYAGMEILESDYFGPGGTIVHPHARLGDLRPDGFSVVPCPAQMPGHKVHCLNCTLCRAAREKSLCIAFDPHGARKKSLPLQQ